ncbi:MAG: hypothetical protein LEGION0398_MBIBDBAK_01464 [Legionellaceae bacterium]
MSQKGPQKWRHYRKELAILANSPYVFLTGLTGVGKSTFVEKYLANDDGTQLYQGESKILDWALDKNSKRKILFIDEANIGNYQWSQFEGLFNTPPGIVIEGTYYFLTSEHKVVFAGNPLSYGDGRNVPSLFVRHGNALMFEPLPSYFINETVIKPLLKESNDDFYTEKVAKQILSVYNFLCQCSTDKVLITPRQVQMMVLLILSSYESRDKQDSDFQIEKYNSNSLKINLLTTTSSSVSFSLFDSLYKTTEKNMSQNIFQIAKDITYQIGFNLLPESSEYVSLFDLLFKHKRNNQPQKIEKPSCTNYRCRPRKRRRSEADSPW